MAELDFRRIKRHCAGELFMRHHKKAKMLVTVVTVSATVSETVPVL